MYLIPRMVEALGLFSEFTGSRELPMQQINMLLALIGAPEPLSMEALRTASGGSQAAGSRNVAILGEGLNGAPGYGLVESFRDPKNKRRSLVGLTEYGEELRERMQALSDRAPEEAAEGASVGDKGAAPGACPAPQESPSFRRRARDTGEGPGFDMAAAYVLLDRMAKLLDIGDREALDALLAPVKEKARRARPLTARPPRWC